MQLNISIPVAMLSKNRLRLMSGTFIVLLCVGSPLSACPFCYPPSGINQVKAEIFGETFGSRAAAVLAPFPIFAGIVAFIYFGPTKRRQPNE
jgi:hypothetical protein